MDFLRALLGLPSGSSTFADGIDALHFVVLGVTMLGSTVVFTFAALFAVRYRRRGPGPALTEPAKASLAAELLVAGGLLGLFLAWWIIGYVQFVAMATPPDDARVVYVTAKQWMWKFEYPEGATSNDVLVVPAGQKVKLVMTSRDVIHSFFVPEFRVKQDVVPGRYTTVWFEAKPGTYPIWCAEYCGLRHGEMLGEVHVLPEAEHAAWLHARTPAGPASMVERGVEVAAVRGCLACHTLDGARHVGPTWSRLYGSTVALADGRTVVADDAYITRSMMEPLADVVAGFETTMPTYQGQLSPSEVAAIVHLIHALRDGAIPSGVTMPRLDVSPAGAGDAGASGGEAEAGPPTGDERETEPRRP